MNFLLKKISISLLTVLIVFSFVTQQSFKRHNWKQLKIIQYDVTSYYSYLPAFFIYHDLHFNYIDHLPGDLKSQVWYETTETNVRIQKMTMGVALLWTPFFMIAKKYYESKKVDDSGYGKAYQHSIAMAALFYFITGLLFLRKMLLILFDEITAALLIILMSVATNLFEYIVDGGGMSHVYNFSLICIFIWLSLKWNNNIYSFKYLLWLTFVGGLITLIRPVNGIILLFPFFYNLNSIAIKEKIQLLKNNYILLLLGFVAFMLPLLPQLIYWKYATGKFIYDSYGKEEQFYFLQPHILEGLFGFRKGLFIYTPVMLFIFPGLYYSFKYKYPFSIIILIILLVFIYVTFSWWCWWYGGSFGARSIIDLYPLFCLPIGIFVHSILNKGIIPKILFCSLSIFFIWLNLFQTRQYESTLLHYDSMTTKSYFKIFGREYWPKDYNKIINHPDYIKASKGQKE